MREMSTVAFTLMRATEKGKIVGYYAGTYEAIQYVEFRRASDSPEIRHDRFSSAKYTFAPPRVPQKSSSNKGKYHESIARCSRTAVPRPRHLLASTLPHPQQVLLAAQTAGNPVVLAQNPLLTTASTSYIDAYAATSGTDICARINTGMGTGNRQTADRQYATKRQQCDGGRARFYGKLEL